MKTCLSNLAMKSDYNTNMLTENILWKMFRVPIQMLCSQAQTAEQKRKPHKYPFSIFISSFLSLFRTSWEWLLCIMAFSTTERSWQNCGYSSDRCFLVEQKYAHSENCKTALIISLEYRKRI